MECFRAVSALIEHSSFSKFRTFLPNRASIGCDPLNVSADRILPGFGRKRRTIEKRDSH